METNKNNANSPIQDSLEKAVDHFAQMVSQFEAMAVHETELMSLSVRQMLYLEAVAQVGQPTFSELAGRLGVSKPSVTAIIGKLIQMGILEKVQSGEDRRVFFINLTEKGHQLAELHTNHHRRIARHFMQVLNEGEVAQLLQLLQKIIQKAGE